MNRKNSTALTLTFLLIGALVTAVIAQDTGPEPPVATTPAIVTPPDGPPVGLYDQGFPNYSVWSSGQGVPGLLRYSNMNSPESKAVAQALQKLQSAESDEDKNAARRELKTALGVQYDANLKSYEEQLDKMEKKLAELREQLQRRRTAKSEIVELHLQLKVNEAAGLGWPTGSLNSRSLMPNSQGPFSVRPTAPRATTVKGGRTR